MDPIGFSPKKPWLTPAKQVAHLKSKGVRFDFRSADEATEYLKNNNNYFRLRSYRTGFSKVDEGARKGQYANLDFEMLVDLSIIDMLLRYEMLPLTLDIEHFYKVKLLSLIEGHGEDGYGIVEDFIRSYDVVGTSGKISNSMLNELEKGFKSPYTCSLLDRYSPTLPNAMPVWVFIELISFGSFLYLYKFCAVRFHDDEMKDDFFLLQSVRSLRNACAHNNCVLNDLRAKKRPMFKCRYAVSTAVGQIETIGLDQGRNRLKNDRLQQIATTLFVHKLIASKGVHENRAVSLHKFADRMNKNGGFYEGNYQVLSSFDFITKIIDAWFSVD